MYHTRTETNSATTEKWLNTQNIAQVFFADTRNLYTFTIHIEYKAAPEQIIRDETQTQSRKQDKRTQEKTYEK